jgi:hypothetical protein
VSKLSGLSFAFIALVSSVSVLTQTDPSALAQLVVECVEREQPEISEAQQEQRQEELESRLQVMLRYFEAKHQVMHDLVAGRLALVEAAACFRDLYNDLPESLKYIERLGANSADDEQLCRYVIAWTRTVLSSQTPSQAEMVAVRLEDELSRHLCEHGGRLYLPSTAGRPSL